MKNHPPFCYFSILLFCFSALCQAANVTYDRQSLIIDGQRKLLISAAIHYPRSVPEMWPMLVHNAKDGGADVIETYVFWNVHEPTALGDYHFEGRFDLVKFIKIVHDAGMYLILRIGPFIAAEWNFGGIPVWLHYVPKTVFRTDNSNFKFYMKKFMTYIVKIMKRENLFAWQGGPIILTQVENEYGYYENSYGDGGKRYAKWAAKMAFNQKTGVPWLMCQQYDSPDFVINTCNSFYCETFKPLHEGMPKIWTENWPGWFQTFGDANPHRPPEDVAFSVSRFFQKGGCLMNYYMYHGGTNFGRTAGGPFITTSYDYDAPIDEYDVFVEPSGACAAFLANTDPRNDANVTFNNVTHFLPAWSVSILPDCKKAIYNSAQVSSQTTLVDMIPTMLQRSDSNGLEWEIFVENVGLWGEPEFVQSGFFDHINTTRDVSDYLWYTTSVFVETEDSVIEGDQVTLVVQSKGHAVHVFVNQKLQGSASGNGTHPPFVFEEPIALKSGINEIALLSMTVGLKNAGSYYEWVGAGPIDVRIEGLQNGTLDLSSFNWTHKVGLQGESLRLSQPSGHQNANWVSASEVPKNQPLTWYKAIVDAPSGSEPIGLDMNEMGKGFAWLNGEEIGRYWPRKSSVNDNCSRECDYRGMFKDGKCRTGCGEPTQRWYHIPRSWFKPSGNVLVFFEETGGDPSKVVFSRRVISGVCGLVAENFVANYVKLKCPVDKIISKVKFASYGTPKGVCGSYVATDCHDPKSKFSVEKACINMNECRVELRGNSFKEKLCPGNIKKLAVEVECS